MLTFWNTLLKKIFALSNYLQQESFDVNTAVQLIDACMLQITELRSLEAFVAMENMARELATLCKGTTDYLQDRVRKKKKTWSAQCSESPIFQNLNIPEVVPLA